MVHVVQGCSCLALEGVTRSLLKLNAIKILKLIMKFTDKEEREDKDSWRQRQWSYVHSSGRQ